MRKIECSDEMYEFLVNFMKDYTESTCAALYDEACEIVKKAEKQESPVIGEDLCFVYRGQHFELLNMVGASNQALMDKNFKNVLSDKYALFALHDDIAEDKDTCPDATQLFLQWWFGSDFDLVPGQKVPEHVLDEINERWDEIQRTLYGNEAK